jgi:hypothetical protein
MKGTWVLLQMSNEAAGREREEFGRFSTLAAAADYYAKEMAA